jgi:hypothetical protein
VQYYVRYLFAVYNCCSISLGKRLGLKLTGDSGEASKKTRIDMFRAMTGYVPPEEKEIEQPVEFPFFTGRANIINLDDYIRDAVKF